MEVISLDITVDLRNDPEWLNSWIEEWLSSDEKDRYFVKQEFLHTIVRFSEKFSVWNILEHKPECMLEGLSDYEDAYLSALLEWLCHKYKQNIPQWLKESGLNLKDPSFPPFSNSELRLFLMIDSPSPFLIRNIFISHDAMEVF